MKKMYTFQGQEVPGEEVEFEVEREGFNTYILQDGSKLKMKSVVTKIVRLDKYNRDGEPIYMINSTNLATVDAPDALKGKPE